MKKYRRNPLVIYNDNEEKKQIYHPGSGNFHELNGGAFLIWDKLQDWITQQEITEAIVMNFKDTLQMLLNKMYQDS